MYERFCWISESPMAAPLACVWISTLRKKSLEIVFFGVSILLRSSLDSSRSRFAVFWRGHIECTWKWRLRKDSLNCPFRKVVRVGPDVAYVLSTGQQVHGCISSSGAPEMNPGFASRFNLFLSLSVLSSETSLPISIRKAYVHRLMSWESTNENRQVYSSSESNSHKIYIYIVYNPTSVAT